MEFRDPNGETQTVSNSITIWPAKWLVGIRSDDWVSSPGHVRVPRRGGRGGRQAGRRRAGARRNFHPQNVLATASAWLADFTPTRTPPRRARAGELCSGVTDSARPAAVRRENRRSPARWRCRPSVRDDAGHSSSAYTEVLHPRRRIASCSEGHDDDRMDVLPEKPQYQPGDTARFQVRMPFRRGDRAGHRRARGSHRGLGGSSLGPQTRSSRCPCATTRPTCSSRCWRCAGGSDRLSRPRWSTSASRPSSSASRKSASDGATNRAERNASRRSARSIACARKRT